MFSKRWKRKRWKRMILALLLLFAAITNVDLRHVVSGDIFNVVSSDIFKYDSESIETDEIEVATIVKIVDGDTIVVAINGVEKKVRLIGIDTPESVHPDKEKNTEHGDIASDYTKKRLGIGEEVYLTKDKSEVDRYQRLLRFVWTEKPDNPSDKTEIRNKMYNAELLLQGFAVAKAYEPDTSLSKLFKELQEEVESK